ncbi:response regulator [Erythrobacter arachoides]|uniref:Response regulator n=1 Tax=Aurantiacibacter arachoides TaxID=1850444 RepID=A0A845AA00_9SPHN|nr:response regulator [Aurantiacibacter arachoides]MXO94389.1 response regulator [Aurantiacibacter arachoides]GGD63855.1 hypothetical protein GCM10011411_25170 [Aurantiacibacter arachoides]
MQYNSVLILEDEAIVAFALEDMLIDLGCNKVCLATTIDEAFGCLEKFVPEVAVLDVNIRGERSYGVAKALNFRGIPFIFATGYGDAEHPEAFAGVTTLTKPYSPEQLSAALEASGG